jgi:hypothetical protein
VEINTSQLRGDEMQDSNNATNKRVEKSVALIPLLLEEQYTTMQNGTSVDHFREYELD